MRHIARVVPLLVLIVGIIVAIRELIRLEAVASDVILTGVYVFGGVAALFLLLIGVGKLLGILANRGERRAFDEETTSDDSSAH